MINTRHYDKLDEHYFNNINAAIDRFKTENAMQLEELDGFFTALHCFPEMVPPSVYFPEIWGGGEMPADSAFESDEEASAFFAAITTHWNNVQQRLSEDDIFLPIIDEQDKDEVPAQKWAIGFLRGAEFSRSDWSDFLGDDDKSGHAVALLTLAHINDPDESLRPYKELPDEEKQSKLLIYLSAGVSNICNYFAEQRKFNARMARETGVIRREAPKIGRNSLCPCGSGKKYKHCCAVMSVR